MPVVHSSASVFSTEGVLRGHGPSSNVSTTSFSRRKSSCLKCSKPKPGPPVVSISTTRPIPSASGLAQGALAGAGATAAGGVAGLLVAGVCDHAVPDTHSETAPAKIKPAAIRILLVPYRDPGPGLGFLPSPEPFPARDDHSLVGPARPRQRLFRQWWICRPKRLIPGRPVLGFEAFLCANRCHPTPTAEQNSPENAVTSGIRERPRNRGFNACIQGVDALRKDLGEITVTANQILVKVPARNILRSRIGSPFVKGMRIRALHDRLGRNREGHSILVLRGFRDLGGAAGFLFSEIIGGNADNHQASIVEFGPQLLQPGILRGEAA